MKTFIYLLCFVSLPLVAQISVESKIQGDSKHNYHVNLQEFNFKPTELAGKESKYLSTVFNNYSVYEFPITEFDKFIDSTPYSLAFNWVINGKKYKINLQRNDLRSPTYKSTTTYLKGKKTKHRDIAKESYKDVITFKGFVNDNPKNYLRASIDDGILTGYFYDNDVKEWTAFETVCSILRGMPSGNGVIKPSKGEILNLKSFDKPQIVKPTDGFNGLKKCNTVVFYHPDDIITTDHDCNDGENDEGGSGTDPGETTTATGCTPFVIEIATEADFEYFQNHGNSVNNANNEILTQLNLVEGVYAATFNTIFSVTFQHVYATPNDIFSSTDDAQLLLDELRNFWMSNHAGINRDITALFSGKSTLKSGNTDINGKIYAAVNDSDFANGDDGFASVCQYPSFAYEISRDRTGLYLTLAHEFAHLFNARHAHCSEDGPNGSDDRSIICPGPKSLYFGEDGRSVILDHMINNSGCLGQSVATSVTSNWIKTYTNDRNGKWMGTWYIQNGDVKVVGDFNGDGDDEFLWTHEDSWCTMLEFECGLGSDWRHEWSNMGNGHITSWNMNDGDKHWAADFNGDGKDDLLSLSANKEWVSIRTYNQGNNTWDWMWNNNGSGWITGWNIRANDRYKFGDFDGDGADEILCFSDDGWSALLDYDGTNMNVIWHNNGDSTIGAVEANAANVYKPGNFTLATSKDELLTFVNSWVTVLRYNPNNWQWEWIWSQYGDNHFASMYILPLNSQQKIRVGNLDNDPQDEVFNLNHTWCATADYNGTDFTQNWNNGGTGYLTNSNTGFYENWDLSLTNSYKMVRPTLDYETQLMGIQKFNGGDNFRVALFRPTLNQNYKTDNWPISEPLKAESTITLFPNPAMDIVNINFNKIADAEISIIDAHGKLVKKERCTESDSYQLQLNNLGCGLYIVNIATNNKVVSKKIYIK